MKIDTSIAQPPNTQRSILEMPNRDGIGMGSIRPLEMAYLAYTEVDHEAGTAFIVKNRRDKGLFGEVTLDELRNEFFEILMLDVGDHIDDMRNPNPDGGGVIPPLNTEEIHSMVGGIFKRLKSTDDFI